MRPSKRIIGIAAAVALATGMATTDRAYASTFNGTQIEYVENSDTAYAEHSLAFWRAMAVSLVLAAL